MWPVTGLVSSSAAAIGIASRPLIINLRDIVEQYLLGDCSAQIMALRFKVFVK
jgi:hypothetical protein